jgi:hypothetical protein
MEAAVLQLWQDYLNTLAAGCDRSVKPADVFSFGDSREMADELGVLVRQGIKTATCSALSRYEKTKRHYHKQEIFRLLWTGAVFQSESLKRLKCLYRRSTKFLNGLPMRKGKEIGR